MRTVTIAGLLLGACSQPGDSPSGNAPSLTAPAQGWQVRMSGDGPALVLAGGDGAAEIRIICGPGRRLLVNVPDFEPVASEERLSFGQGGEAMALVADVRGDRDRGGVTGEGALPSNLTALLSGRVSASYGAQSSGPHPAPPEALVSAFASTCSGDTPGKSDNRGRREPAEAAPADFANPSACLKSREGDPVPANAIKVLGTEPFWAALVEGRCVTYSHPDDQSGTRVWTTFSGTQRNGTWTGSLGGQPFVMKTAPQAGCSDGMSDKRYPIAVSLTVGGGQRSGCAEPR